MAPRDPFAFIDLARFGRTDVASFLKALVRFAAFAFAGGFVAGFAQAIGQRFGWNGPLTYDMILIACFTLMMLQAVKLAALKSDQRPFGLLNSADGRFEVSRVAAGAFAWILASCLTFGTWLALDPEPSAPLQIDWPSTRFIIAAATILLIVPFQAASEELIFRGWLTQRIGQWIRWRGLLAIVVGALFALVHGFALGLLAFPYYIMMSLIFTAFCMRDQRLELAIGAHAGHNIFLMLVSVADAPMSSVLKSTTTLEPVAFAVLACQGSLAFLLISLADRWRQVRGEPVQAS